MIRLHAAALIAATLASAVPAQAYVAANGLIVQPRADGTIFVPYRGRTAEVAFWCAVGDYVTNVLRAPGGTRIFRISEPPRRSGEGVIFSLDGTNAASSTGLNISGNSPEGSVAAVTAYALCPPRFRFGIGLWWDDF